MRLLQRLVSLLPHTTITINGKPYLTRYYVFGKDRTWGNIYIHHFHSSDQGLELHNHPWKWGFSIVVSGGYFEERSRNPYRWEKRGDPMPFNPLGQDEDIWIPTGSPWPPKVVIERRDVRPGTINIIWPTDFHRVDLKDEARGAWSLFFAGPRTKDWGFLDRETAEYKDWRKNPEAIP